jgi:hypothetical protein
MALKPSPVQIRLVDTVAGIKIPKTNLGVSVLSSAYLQFRFGNASALYGIAVGLKVGSGSLIICSIATDWISISHSDDIQPRMLRLAGLLADIEVNGFVVGGFGKVDVSIKIYDENGSEFMSMANVDQPATGILAADAKIRGNLVLINSDSGVGDFPNPTAAERVA